MNSLELEFLFMINFTLYVTPEVYRHYEHELMMRTLSMQASKTLHAYLPFCEWLPHYTVNKICCRFPCCGCSTVRLVWYRASGGSCVSGCALSGFHGTSDLCICAD